jgi:hypothetical protein
LPDGTKKPLLWIDDWDFKWQNFYEYAAPVKLPKGTRLVMECLHDNSASNPHNPSTPPKRIKWGEQTFDEMSAVMIQIVPERDSDLAALVGGMAQRIVGRILPQTAEVKQLTEQAVARQVEQAIGKFDKDGDKKLSLDELAAIPSAKEVAGILVRFDKDGDKKLDAAELATAIKALTGR